MNRASKFILAEHQGMITAGFWYNECDNSCAPKWADTDKIRKWNEH